MCVCGVCGVGSLPPHRTSYAVGPSVGNPLPTHARTRTHARTHASSRQRYPPSPSSYRPDQAATRLRRGCPPTRAPPRRRRAEPGCGSQEQARQRGRCMRGGGLEKAKMRTGGRHPGRRGGTALPGASKTRPADAQQRRGHSGGGGKHTVHPRPRTSAPPRRRRAGPHFGRTVHPRRGQAHTPAVGRVRRRRAPPVSTSRAALAAFYFFVRRGTGACPCVAAGLASGPTVPPRATLSWMQVCVRYRVYAGLPGVGPRCQPAEACASVVTAGVGVSAATTRGRATRPASAAAIRGGIAGGGGGDTLRERSAPTSPRRPGSSADSRARQARRALHTWQAAGSWHAGSRAPPGTEPPCYTGRAPRAPRGEAVRYLPLTRRV